MEPQQTQPASCLPRARIAVLIVALATVGLVDTTRWFGGGSVRLVKVVATRTTLEEQSLHTTVAPSQASVARTTTPQSTAHPTTPSMHTSDAETTYATSSMNFTDATPSSATPDATVPRATLTPAAEQAHVEPNANLTIDAAVWGIPQLRQCLARAARRQAASWRVESVVPGQEENALIQLMGTAESHGRYLFESIAQRFATDPGIDSLSERHTERHRTWMWAAPIGTNTTAVVINGFDATFGRGGVVKRPQLAARWKRKARGATALLNATHHLVSRGGWDAEVFGTTLRRVHDEIMAGLRVVGTWRDVETITFRLIHPTWVSTLAVDRSQARCRREDIMRAYRGVAACAVARYMRESAAAKALTTTNRVSTAGPKRVTVLDAWDLGMRAGPAGYKPDGQHFGPLLNDLTTDAFLLASVCPGLKHPTLDASGRGGDVWWSSDTAEIERRFDCDASFPLTAEAATDRIRRGPLTIGPWDVAHGTAQEVGCMCGFDDAKNDHCALRRMTGKLNPPALTFVTYLCTAVPFAAGSTFLTNLTAAVIRQRDGGVRLSTVAHELLLEICVDPRLGVDALLSLGAGDASIWGHLRQLIGANADAFGRCSDASSPHASTAWCQSAKRRLQPTRRDLKKLHGVLSSQFLRGSNSAAVDCRDLRPWRTLLTMVCHPSWREEKDMRLRLKAALGRVSDTVGKDEAFNVLRGTAQAAFRSNDF